MTMKTLTRQEAHDAGYYSITSPIHPENDKFIMDSIERSLSGVPAVWIKFSEWHFEAARKRGTVHLLTRNLR